MTVTALGCAVGAPSSPADGRAPADGPLVDTFGRVATDLRVSLTDRCNLRCTYCMPAEGLDWLPGEQLLRPDELTRLLRIAVTRLGITSVRFTGGEPLVSRHLEEVIAAAAALRPRPEIALTTNGIGLARRAAALKRRRPGPGQRLAGHRRRRRASRASPAATGSPTCSTGLAAAARRGSDAGEGERRARSGHRTRRCGDAAAVLPRARIPAAHHRADAAGRRPPVAARPDARRRRRSWPRCAVTSTLRPDPAPRGSAPAQLWLVDGGPATVGIIASVSHAFCAACDRTRLTADGQVRSCLFSREETDLRRAAARRRRRRRDRGGVARRDVGQARGARHQRPRASSSRTDR